MLSSFKSGNINWERSRGCHLNYFFHLDCDINCHKKCEKLTANLCGVNQKLIVEALSSVRKGKFVKEPKRYLQRTLKLL